MRLKDKKHTSEFIHNELTSLFQDFGIPNLTDNEKSFLKNKQEYLTKLFPFLVMLESNRHTVDIHEVKDNIQLIELMDKAEKLHPKLAGMIIEPLRETIRNCRAQEFFKWQQLNSH